MIPLPPISSLFPYTTLFRSRFTFPIRKSDFLASISLLPVSKSDLLVSISLLLVRKSDLLASVSLLLVRKSDFLVSISLLLVRKSDFLASIPLLLVRKAISSLPTNWRRFPTICPLSGGPSLAKREGPCPGHSKSNNSFKNFHERCIFRPLSPVLWAEGSFFNLGERLVGSGRGVDR